MSREDAPLGTGFTLSLLLLHSDPPFAPDPELLGCEVASFNPHCSDEDPEAQSLGPRGFKTARGSLDVTPRAWHTAALSKWQRPHHCHRALRRPSCGCTSCPRSQQGQGLAPYIPSHPGGYSPAGRWGREEAGWTQEALPVWCHCLCAPRCPAPFPRCWVRSSSGQRLGRIYSLELH